MSILIPLAVLSAQPHQEPRFLLPLLVPTCILASLHADKVRRTMALVRNVLSNGPIAHADIPSREHSQPSNHLSLCFSLALLIRVA